MTGHSQADDNPLLKPFETAFEIPPFDKIAPDQFPPAFEAAFAAHLDEITAITSATESATFENTVVALEKSGWLLARVCRIFFNLANAHTNPELQKIERDIAPRLADHQSKIYLDSALYRRVEEVFQSSSSERLNAEDARLLEQTHKAFIRSGAALTEEKKARVAEISAKLATLATSFSQNVLKDEQDWHLVLEDERALEGLPRDLRNAAQSAAEDLGIKDGYAITLSRSLIEPFLKFSKNRGLRERAYQAWINRGANGGATDNREILKDIVALRHELAGLLGFDTYAAFVVDDQMAKTPENVRGLLDAVWQPALQRVDEEREALQQLVQEDGKNFEIAAWDWRFYAEKLRAQAYQLDDAELRPYFQLDRMIEAAFYVAGKLFGVTFKQVQGAPKHHPDVRVFEVIDQSGSHVGIFMGDYFARSSKHSGAWMSSFRTQHKLVGEVRPIIVNTMNFGRGSAGAPALLSLDDARTLFHEFGHGLHGLLSNVTYPSMSGTSVARDFVELPSQLFEHWLLQPEILKKFALHVETGVPISDELIARIKAAETFNQGFASAEYLASAIADLNLHEADPGTMPDVITFEQTTMTAIAMPKEIGMRHRLSHFGHIVGGYAAGYYSYLWSEVMDADAFQAFVDRGDIFDPELAEKLKTYIYSAGDRQDPEQAYIAFRGRAPSVAGLLKKRGFAVAEV